jgi:4-oxalocrotonate tautomerase
VPFIEVKLWEGRTREQKAELARRMTDALVEVVGCPVDAVSIVFDDYAQADWAEGGRLCDERTAR